MSDIARTLYISKPSMTMLADTLTDNGWITRNNDPEDRRVINLTITPKGKKHLQQAFEIYRIDVRALISELDDQELQRLSASLDNIHQIFTKLESGRK